MLFADLDRPWKQSASRHFCHGARKERMTWDTLHISVSAGRQTMKQMVKAWLSVKQSVLHHVCRGAGVDNSDAWREITCISEFAHRLQISPFIKLYLVFCLKAYFQADVSVMPWINFWSFLIFASLGGKLLALSTLWEWLFKLVGVLGEAHSLPSQPAREQGSKQVRGKYDAKKKYGTQENITARV